MAKEEIEQTLNKEEPRSMTVVGERSRTEPYELPAGWKWIALLDAFENKTSSQKKVPTNEYLKHGQYAIIDQGQEFIGGYTNDESKVFKDNLPVIIFGDHTRNIKFIDFPFAQGADGIKVLKPKDFLDAIFFYYGLKNIVFPDLGYRRHFPLFKNFYFPLPPTLEEQQRIVSRIESLFTKLDEAKDKAQSVVDGFELRRAAILHKAFTGELTAKWRKENGVSDESWEEKTIGEIADVINGKNQKDVEDENGLYPIYGSGGIIGRAKDFLCPENCTIIGRKGTINNPIFVETKFWNVDTAFGMKPYNFVNPKFYFYFCCSFNFTTLDSSTTIPSLTKTNIQKVSLLLPTLPEQQEIVRILDSVLEKETDAKETAERVLEQIALLKKSILARAFRGGL